MKRPSRVSGHRCPCARACSSGEGIGDGAGAHSWTTYEVGAPSSSSDGATRTSPYAAEREGTFVALLAHGSRAPWPWPRQCSGGMVVHPRQLVIWQGVACSGSARGRQACARLLPSVGLPVGIQVP